MNAVNEEFNLKTLYVFCHWGYFFYLSIRLWSSTSQLATNWKYNVWSATLVLLTKQSPYSPRNNTRDVKYFAQKRSLEMSLGLSLVGSSQNRYSFGMWDWFLSLDNIIIFCNITICLISKLVIRSVATTHTSLHWAVLFTNKTYFSCLLKAKTKYQPSARMAPISIPCWSCVP